MADIKLTLGDIPAAPDASAAMAMQEKPVEKPKPAEPVFTAEEQQMIDDFSKQIDITNSTLVFQYGAGTQKNIADFSDTALASVRSKDLGEVGDMISSLVVELRDFTSEPEKERGFFAFFRLTRLPCSRHAMTKPKSTSTRSFPSWKVIRFSCSRISPPSISCMS